LLRVRLRRIELDMFGERSNPNQFRGITLKGVEIPREEGISQQVFCVVPTAPSGVARVVEGVRRRPNGVLTDFVPTSQNSPKVLPGKQADLLLGGVQHDLDFLGIGKLANP
jgi:hypothetical protein